MEFSVIICLPGGKKNIVEKIVHEIYLIEETGSINDIPLGKKWNSLDRDNSFLASFPPQKRVMIWFNKPNYSLSMLLIIEEVWIRSTLNPLLTGGVTKSPTYTYRLKLLLLGEVEDSGTDMGELY